jgi:hypothetical protein
VESSEIPSVRRDRKTYDPERNAAELPVAAMRRGKVVRVCFEGSTVSLAVAGGVDEGLLCDVDAVSHGTVDALWELAVWITGLVGSDFEVGDGDRRGSGGAEGESDDGAGVHVENLKLIRVAVWSGGCRYGSECHTSR